MGDLTFGKAFGVLNDLELENPVFQQRQQYNSSSGSLWASRGYTYSSESRPVVRAGEAQGETHYTPPLCSPLQQSMRKRAQKEESLPDIQGAGASGLVYDGCGAVEGGTW
ncbi:hypothetical protein GLOTRDRAFT_131996 [Gloeophyllum trabeum ATCC 11539]|uniref:Uncharacterized protein n=1 Tax=Gloeophyllum trabeum (strain ATCC 11539 / FP-39264 / Madison 617) TaxID=670483 RepID=S7RJF3_GLOTA|nr:uncharacterized protein GLOTRDRAFT_131996 [Gloeophyllum trabeum ATCC 11539]EPQ52759.1 hypothetical protein GLOTRDRAFT_131996 [Gloeophyllum trabeum ATCC 11539]